MSDLKQRVLRGTLICVLLTCCAGLAAVPRALAASTGLRRLGRAPELPAGARALGALAATTTIHATIALQPRDPAGLAAYAQQVSTPGSSVFHQYLSVAQFAARFGPASPQINAVRAVLVKQGLHPGPVSADHLSIDVAAPAISLKGRAAAVRPWRVHVVVTVVDSHGVTTRLG